MGMGGRPLLPEPAEVPAGWRPGAVALGLLARLGRGRLLTRLGSYPLCSWIARTILLSVISLLNEPNTFSPANVDASVMYRKWKESKGKDREYTDIIRCVRSRALARQHPPGLAER